MRTFSDSSGPQPPDPKTDIRSTAALPRLLVSVRNAAESRIAYHGGASFIDIKEPSNGSLGRASPSVHAEVVETVRSEWAGHGDARPPVVVTAALGELETSDRPASYSPVPGLTLFKLGLSKCGARRDWRERLDAWRERLSGANADLAAVAYADHAVAEAPEPREVLDYAVDRRLPFLLVDTFDKTAGRLGDFVGESELEALLGDAHRHGVRVALAGSLRLEDVSRLAELGTDVIAVRGAACEGGKRDRGLDASRIEALTRILSVSAQAQR